MNLNKAYWQGRYEENRMGWDIGYPSTPLKAFIDHLENKQQKILLPGAGHGYEAEYLFEKGFTNFQVLDIAPLPLERLRKKLPKTEHPRLIEADFFSWEAGEFDLILEQTFFCALQPKQRPAYARKMAETLREGGILAGVLFNFPLTENGPPFGGSAEEYHQYFAPYFHLHVLEPCRNSIPPRAGKELFFIFEKK